MKKTLWIITSIILLGGVVFLLSMSNFRINFNELKIDKLADKKVHVDKSQLKRINLNVNSAKITIRQGKTAEVQLKSITSNQFKISKHDGLNIKEKNSRKHQMRVGKDAEIIVTVPNKVSILQVDQLNGTLSLMDLTVNELKITHNNGTTNANHLNILQSGIINKGNGSTNLKNVSYPGLKVEIGTGTFKLNGIKKASINGSYDDHKTNQLVIDSGN